MGKILDQFNSMFKDREREYLDKEGFKIILDILLSSDNTINKELEELKNKLDNDYQTKNKPLTIASFKDNKSYVYDGNEEKKLTFRFNHEKNDDGESVIWLQCGEINGTKFDNPINLTYFKTTDFLKDDFLQNVEIGEVDGKKSIIFTFKDNNPVSLPIEDLFAGGADQVKLDKITIVSKNNNTYEFATSDETNNVQYQIQALWKQAIDNAEDINDIVEELKRLKPISRYEIYKMLGYKNAEQIFSIIGNNIIEGYFDSLDNDLVFPDGAIVLTLEDQSLDLNGHILEAKGSDDAYNSTVVIANLENDKVSKINVNNGTIKGNMTIDPDELKQRTTIMVCGDVDVTFDNVNIEGVRPVRILSNMHADVEFNNVNVLAHSAEAVYVQNNNGKVIINSGYFKNDFEGYSGPGKTKYLLNLNDALLKNDPSKKATDFIEVRGGEFVNFDPSKSESENPKVSFVAEDYKVGYYMDGDNKVYVVRKEEEPIVNGFEVIWD